MLLRHKKGTSIIAWAVIIIALAFVLGGSANKARIKGWLQDRLTVTDPLDHGKEYWGVYVLGGPQPALKVKYGKAAKLYRQGRAARVMVMHRQGITDYSPSKGRNLSNDEWSIMTLKAQGVPEEDLALLEVGEGFWGTFSEAKAVVALTNERRAGSVVLVSSLHHTRRVALTFKRLDPGEGPRFSVVGVDHECTMFELVCEAAKLIVYDVFLV